MTKFEEFKELLMSNRSFRKFENSRKIDEQTLLKLVELTRFCASGRNLQPIRYRIVINPDECDKVFPFLKWAGYYSDWDGPSLEERPVAYLVQCLDTELTTNLLCDDGLQLEAITLGAASLGIHGVIIKAFNAAGVSESLNIDGRYKPLYVLALGYPSEEVKIVETDGQTNADIRYYHDAEGKHVVPKRPLKELLI